MNKLAIVMYHYIRDLNNSRYPNIKGLDYAHFKQQISFFKHHFNVVTMEEVIAAFNGEHVLPDYAMLLTFDDGYIDHYTFAMPILLENEMQGSFFIPGKTFTESALLDVNKIHFILASQPTEIIVRDLREQLNYYRGQEYPIPSFEELFERYGKANRYDNEETIFIKRVLQTAIPEELRKVISSNLFEKYMNGLSEQQFAKELYMNYDQIKCMKRNGMFIGHHGYDHYWLGSLSREDMINDIKRGLSCLDEIIDRNCWVMNYPYGSYGKDILEFLPTSSCQLGLTTEVRVANLEIDGRYQLPRLDTNDFPPKSRDYLKV